MGMLERPSKKELEAARILQQLPKLMRDSDRRAGILRWGARKKRSEPADEPPPPLLPASRSPPHSTSLRPAHDGQEPDMNTKEEIKMGESLAGVRTSPSTPLSFSPSAGDDTDSKTPAQAKPSTTKPPPPKTLKEHNKLIMQMSQRVATLSADNTNLKRSMEERRSHHERLKARNSRLREIRSKLLREMEERERRGSLDLLPVGPNSYLLSMPVGSTHHLPAPSAQGWAEAAQAHRQVVLPDLNASAEEAEQLQQSAMRAAMSAQARKRRIEIQREKSFSFSPSLPTAAASPSPPLLR